MFRKFNEIWEEYGFEICVIGSLILIAILALFRIGKKGSWDKGIKRDNYRSPYTPQVTKKKDSKGETICRNYLERTFNKSFSKVRPDMLKNFVTDSKSNLELDCYNDDLKLAVEYNGIQHYKYTPYFHRNKDAFENQRYRDFMKKTLCEKNGISLIEVPYTIPHDRIENYLDEKLVKMGFISK